MGRSPKAARGGVADGSVFEVEIGVCRSNVFIVESLHQKYFDINFPRRGPSVRIPSFQIGVQ